MPKIGWLELLIVLIVILFVVRIGRVSRLGRELAEGIREFRRGLAGDEEEE